MNDKVYADRITNMLTSNGYNVSTYNIAKAKYIEKKQAEKKAAKVKEKRQAEKKAQNERLEKLREGNKTEKEYIELWSEDLDDLVNNVAKYTYNHSMDNVLTEEETRVGQNVDFKG